MKEREFTFAATFLLPSPSSDLKVPNIRMGALIKQNTFEGGAYSKGGSLIGRRALKRITVLEATLTVKQPRENI